MANNDERKDLEKLEDAQDLALARQRLEGNLETISQAEFEQAFSIDFAKVEPIDEKELE